MEIEKVHRFLLIIPTVALLLLAAHALRFGDIGLAVSLGCMAGLLHTRQGWARLAVAAALLWGGYVWANATVDFITVRQALAMPWGRLAGIMTGVILLDGLALVIMLSDSMERLFSQGSDRAWSGFFLFALTFFCLAMARHNVSFPILLVDRYFPGWGWFEIFCLALYARWIGVRMLTDAKAHKRIRPWAWGLFSGVFFLQLGLGLLGMERMLMTGSLHLPVPAMILAGPVFRGGGLFMVVLFSVTIFLVGPAWCSHLCYIGAWDDAMSRLGKRSTPSMSIRRLSIAGRVTTLLLVIGTAYCLRRYGVSSVTAAVCGGAFGLAGVGVMAYASRKAGKMVHCTVFCPMGFVASLVGRISPWCIRIGTQCTKCGICYKQCRYNALDETRVVQGKPGFSCTLCGDCVAACPHGQVSYRLPGLSGDYARTVFIVFVVVLHAVFLGVARI